MKDVNKIILVGRLGADPLERKTPRGTTIVSFPVATSRRRKDGESTIDETQWHDVVCWGKQGEALKPHLYKGQPVYVEGSVRTHFYETSEGQKRMSYEVHSESVSLLGVRSEVSRNESES